MPELTDRIEAIRARLLSLSTYPPTQVRDAYLTDVPFLLAEVEKLTIALEDLQGYDDFPDEGPFDEGDLDIPRIKEMQLTITFDNRGRVGIDTRSIRTKEEAITFIESLFDNP